MILARRPSRAHGTPSGALRLLVLLLYCTILACSDSPTPETRPNIVLIVADDQGFDDFGFMGSEVIQTPNLDRLAQEGTVFTHGFVTASICDPSLRSLATGLHPYQWHLRKSALRKRGVDRRIDSEIVDFVTLPRLLTRSGYRGYQAGKFFGGSYELAGFTDGMNDAESDLRFGGPGRKLLGRKTIAPVLEFLDEVERDPFFLWFAPMLPHRPFDAGPELRALYEGQGLSRASERYYANITRFDALVGELIEALEARGLREETLIVFLVDNGWDQGPTDKIGKRWDSDGGRGKRSMYELGFRTPIVFNWPGRIPADVVRDELVSSVDLFPTLLDHAGVEAPGDRSGVNLRGVIEGSDSWPRTYIAAHMRDIRSSGLRPEGAKDKAHEPAALVRTEDWHYIDYEEWGVGELFDVNRDPGQSRNVVADHPEVAARLREEISLWKERMRKSYEAGIARPPAAEPPPD